MSQIQPQSSQLRQGFQASSTSLDSKSQIEHANGGDWQEEIYQKIKIMKDMYLPEINEMYQKIDGKVQQHDSLPQQLNPDHLDKLKLFKTMLEGIITFLQVSKSNIKPNYKEKLGFYEKQIVNFIRTNRRRKPVSSTLQGQLPPPPVGDMQQQQRKQQQQQLMAQQSNLYNMHQQQQFLGTQTASLDSTSQTGHANGGDWQSDQVYQKETPGTSLMLSWEAGSSSSVPPRQTCSSTRPSPSVALPSWHVSLYEDPVHIREHIVERPASALGCPLPSKYRQLTRAEIEGLLQLVGALKDMVTRGSQRERVLEAQVVQNEQYALELQREVTLLKTVHGPWDV